MRHRRGCRFPADARRRSVRGVQQPGGQTHEDPLIALWLNSHVLLNPANDLSKPLANFGKPKLYPGAIEVKMRYEMTRMRAIHDAAAAAGLGSRVRVVKGICLDGFQDDIYGLAWGKEKYGSLAWLDTMGGGLSPAYYLRPANPHGMDTTDKVFQQLEEARVGVAGSLIKLRNILLAMGQSTINGYEGGPHNDIKPAEAGRKPCRSPTARTHACRCCWPAPGRTGPTAAARR
jgi:hypothetical protein